MSQLANGITCFSAFLDWNVTRDCSTATVKANTCSIVPVCEPTKKLQKKEINKWNHVNHKMEEFLKIYDWQLANIFQFILSTVILLVWRHFESYEGNWFRNETNDSFDNLLTNLNCEITFKEFRAFSLKMQYRRKKSLV